MHKSKKYIYIAISAVFLLCETVLGIFIHTSHGKNINLYQFLSIILAFAFCFVFIERKREYIYTQLALLFTVFADYFLVWVSPQMQTAGMIFFIYAQMFYATRLYITEDKENRKKAQLISRAVLSALILGITAIVLGANTDLLSLVSMLYYVNLILNIVFSFASFKKHYLLAIGFTLFLLCDTAIGLSLLKNYFTIDPASLLYKILYPGINLAWVFYLPSQMLLAISLLPQKIKNINQ